VQGVAAGLLVGVNPGGRDDFGVAVGGHADVPVAGVDEGVVVSAQNGTRPEDGGAVTISRAVGVVTAVPAMTSYHTYVRYQTSKCDEHE
jgi:hypothetical protein